MNGIRLGILFCIASLAALAQPAGSIRFVTADPSGSCNAKYLEYNVTNGNLWGCEAGTWTLVSGGGGGGAVASVTAGPRGSISVSPTTGATVVDTTDGVCIVSLACAPTNVFDLSGSTKSLPFQNASSAPGSPSESQVYYNTTTHAPSYYNGSSFVLFGGSATWGSIGSGTDSTHTYHMASGSTMDHAGGGIIDATAIGGVTVTGTPSVGNVPIASSSSAATWGAPSGGGPAVYIASGTPATGAKILTFALTVGDDTSYDATAVGFTAMPHCTTIQSGAIANYQTVNYCRSAGVACANVSTATTLWFSSWPRNGTNIPSDVICVGN